VKFCSECAAEVLLEIPQGDNRPRYICRQCSSIYYQNPKVIVGTIPLYISADGAPKILLCRRAIEPRHGYWTLPAGFLENGETALQGARRETEEESCANVERLSLYRLFNVPGADQIHLFFRAEMPQPGCESTSESSEVRLFDFAEIPWDELAFSTVYQALKDFLADYSVGEFAVQMVDIDRAQWRRGESG